MENSPVSHADRIRLKALCATGAMLTANDRAILMIIEIEDALLRGTKHYAKDGRPLGTIQEILVALRTDGEIAFESGSN